MVRKYPKLRDVIYRRPLKRMPTVDLNIPKANARNDSSHPFFVSNNHFQKLCNTTLISWRPKIHFWGYPHECRILKMFENMV